MSGTRVFLVNFHREEGSPVVERMVVQVRAIVWPFAQRLWRQLRGAAEIPAGVQPLMILQPGLSSPVQEAPPPIDPFVNGRWSFSPARELTYPVVEFRLDTEDESLGHGFYRLGDVFDRPLATLAEILATRGEPLGDPGHYLYDVLLIASKAVRGRRRGLRTESPAFSAGSFELPPIDDGDPLLDFERLQDQPLSRALQARPFFLVPGSHRIGETRFAASAWENLALTLPMSLEREIGGYLVGSVGEGENGDETVTVHHAVPAELSAGDAHTLLMSAESGAEIRQRIQKDWPGDELVGWYHTHVFSAMNDILSGLSEIDVQTHDEQFTRSWQLAVLVNVWREGGTVSRQVRSFRRNGSGKLVDVDYSVVEREDAP
jgi:proteasome lid subunit RPN8/RPN11